MSGTGIFRRITEAVDRRFVADVGAIPVPGSEQRLLLICFHPYHGKKPVQIPPQVTINPGDSVCELHFSNQRITQIAAAAGERPIEWHIFEILKGEFAQLAKALRDGQVPQEIRGIYGVNTMGSVSKRLGFTLIPLPKGLNRIWLGFWESLLRRIYYSYKTSKKANFKRMMDPHEIWISREELLRRHLKDSSPGL